MTGNVAGGLLAVPGMPGGGEIKGWGMEFDVLDRFAKYARQGQCESDLSGQTARPRRAQ